MRLYWEVARRSFRRWSTYRGAAAAGAFTNSVFGFIRAYVFIAIYHQRASVNGFDVTDAITFTFVSQGFLALVSVFRPELGLTERIRTGEVVSDLSRPVDVQGWFLAQDLGRAAFTTVARGLPPILAGALVFHLRLPHDPARLAVFGLSLLLALLVSFGVRFLMSLCAFWLIDERGPQQLLMVMLLFFGGVIIPVTFFPAWLAHVARALPFVAMIQLPIEVFLGKHTGGDLVRVLLVQAAWAAALLAAGRAVWAAATRKVVVHGG